MPDASNPASNPASNSAPNSAPHPETETAPVLALTDLRSGYGAHDVLNGVALEVRAAEIFALMGKNGMGKSTLLKTVLGLVPARAGDVRRAGVSILGATPAALVASGLGYAPQEQPLFVDLSIRDNLRLALRSDKELPGALERVAAHFPFFLNRLGQKAGTLSGGEQKMLILSRALMLRPRLLLIDEISEGLQPTVVARIAAALRAERDENGTAVLLVEQNLDFALSVADRWAVLKLGAIDDEGDNDAQARDRVLAHLKI